MPFGIPGSASGFPNLRNEVAYEDARSGSSWTAAAARLVQRVAVVLDVANDIQVKMAETAGRTDTEIASAVRHALLWDVLIPDGRIQSTVSEGWVTLEGEVDCWSQRENAEKAIRNLTCVRGVNNRITSGSSK